MRVDGLVVRRRSGGELVALSLGELDEDRDPHHNRPTQLESLLDKRNLGQLNVSDPASVGRASRVSIYSTTKTAR